MTDPAKPFSADEIAGYRKAIPGALDMARGRDRTEIRKDARWLATVDALQSQVVALEAALLDCQRYVLDNGIDVARVKVAARVAEALK